MNDTEKQDIIDKELIEILEASQKGVCLCMCGDSSGFEVIEQTSDYIISLIKADLESRKVI